MVSSSGEGIGRCDGRGEAVKRNPVPRRPGVTVTELGFGGAPVGNLYTAVSDDGAVAAIDAAWECGIRYFDTAPHYGLGLSEQRLGKALARQPRSQTVLSTKVGRLLVPAGLGPPQGDDGFVVDCRPHTSLRLQR